METIKIIPLGGVRENGKNMYIAEVGEDIFVLDCGVRYPENELLGIDTVIPDFTYLEENADRVAGSFDSWTCRRHWGAALFLGECSSSGVWNRANDRIGKIDRSKNEATKKFKDFHIIDEHSEIDFWSCNHQLFPDNAFDS